MKLKLNLIKEYERRDQWEVPSDWLNPYLSEEFAEGNLVPPLFKSTSPLSLKTNVYENDEEFFFKAEVKGELQGTCVRCLKDDLPLPMELEFGGIFILRKDETMPEPEDPGHYFYSNEELDFGQALLENIFLELPSNPTCQSLSGQPCPPEMEEDLDKDEKEFEASKPKLDPRWAALQKIRESMDDPK